MQKSFQFVDAAKPVHEVYFKTYSDNVNGNTYSDQREKINNNNNNK